MKVDLTEESQTKKQLAFEVPSDVVVAEVERVAQGYSKKARVPGFRPGKVPAAVVKQRYKDQILYDVAHDLIPRLVGTALRERGLDPVATPDIRDVEITEGQPLKFVAAFETLPPIDPGDVTGITLRKPPAVLDVGAVDQALERLRERAAKWHPVEDRPSAMGDTLLVDLIRTPKPRTIALPGETLPEVKPEDIKPEPLKGAPVEIGGQNNPPGFDEHLIGLTAGASTTFDVNYPADYENKDLAGLRFEFAVTVTAIRRKELPALDDELAKEVSDVETLDALRGQVQKDLQQHAEDEAEHQVRHELLQNLSGRMKSEVPDALVEHEVDRRLEEFLRRLMEQGVDPEKAGIDWQDFRARQREGAVATVRGTLILDEIARREQIEAAEADVDQEIEKFAERSGRTGPAIRARLEKEGGLDRIRTGVRREKTLAWVLAKANIVNG